MKTKKRTTTARKKSLTATQQTELRTEMEEELRRLVPAPWSPEALQDLAPARRRRGLQLLDALRRLDAGSYGTCHGCRLPISYVRLSVMPETTVCVDCSAARETSLRA
jgi:RNA polymerase-binding transcription factor DksA